MRWQGEGQSAEDQDVQFCVSLPSRDVDALSEGRGIGNF